MTLTITEMQLYKCIVVILLILQIYQQRQVHKLQKECLSLREHFGIFVVSVANELLGLQEELGKKAS